MPLYISNTNRQQSLQDEPRGAYKTQFRPNLPGLALYQYTGSPDILSSSLQIPALPQSGSTFAQSGSLQPTYLAEGKNRMSAQWLGYFKTDTTGVYTFYTEVDDAIWWWVGNDALNNSTNITGSAILGIATTPPAGGNRLTGSFFCDADVYYPMRIQYNTVTLPNFFTASFEGPTVTKTTDFTDYSFCNSSSITGFGF